QDRRFLARYMPTLEAHLHYRIVDVSTIKELARRWYPGQPMPEKKKTHLAVDDVRESIEELRFYRRTLFRCIRRGIQEPRRFVSTRAAPRAARSSGGSALG